MENEIIKADSTGKHILANLHGIKNAKHFDDTSVLKKVLYDAAKYAGMDVVGESFYKFSPVGITGVLVLSSSHLSVHLWQEEAFMAVDIYTCGSTGNPQKALDYLIKVLKPELNECKILSLDRSIYTEKPFGYSLYLDVHGCRPTKKLDSMDTCYDFLNDLLKLIGMHKQSEPQVVRTDSDLYPDKKGLSASVFLVESGIMFHSVSTEKSFISLDLYSCKLFDKEAVKKFLKKVYNPKIISNEQFFERGTTYNSYNDQFSIKQLKK